MAPTARSRVTLLLLGLLLLRLALMAALPLNDTTEARYAEIARKMLESGDWVTLWHDYGVPFWAKPPLSTWLGAAAMGLFGENELAVRLPSLLLGLATLWLTAELARRRDGAAAGRASALILAGSLLFFVAAGAMMTDPALLLAVTLSLAAFWHALHGGGRLWGYAFFAGLGLGLLAKGPLAVVLVGLTVAPWVALRRQWRALWQCLPWPGGSLLALAIALPWYALAEWRTPGFLEYFIVGEHLGRFLDPGWSGDRYGFAHASPRGLIWLHAAGALLPWSLLAPLWWWRARRSAAPADADGWRLYLWLWTLAPLLFFSLSGNVIFPYALPALPGRSVAFAIESGDVSVAGGRAAKGRIVRQGEEVVIRRIPEEADWLPRAGDLPGASVLYEDDSVTVLDKPADAHTEPHRPGEAGTLAGYLLYRHPAVARFARVATSCKG